MGLSKTWESPQLLKTEGYTQNKKVEMEHICCIYKVKKFAVLNVL